MVNQGNEWVSTGRTFLRALPRPTAITVREVTPERFDVTFPVEAHVLKQGVLFLLWGAMMLPLMIVAALLPRVPFFLWVTLAFFVPFWIAGRIGRRFRRADGGRSV